MSERAYLREPFESLARQREAATFGMWVFLATEVLFFAALFGGYAVYRHFFPGGFLSGSRATDIWYGTANTAIMLTSSLAIAMAGRAARARLCGIAWRLLIVTFALGAVFLAVKGFEYADDISKNLVPGNAAFPIRAGGAQLFWSFYWAMTGVHAIHVTGGLTAVGRLIWTSRRDRDWLTGSGSEEATALYWHFVDVIWVILYPLIYLGGRAHG